MQGDVFREWPVVQVHLDTVSPHPENYRDHDLGAIIASIERWGLWRPIVVQKSTLFVIVGNGEWKALQAIRNDEVVWPRSVERHHVPAVVLDVDDDNARAIMLADNWIPSRGRNMPAELLALMQELREERELFEATGIEDEDVEATMRALEDEDGEGPPLDPTRGRKKAAPKPRKVECPECGHKFEIGGKP